MNRQKHRTQRRKAPPIPWGRLAEVVVPAARDLIEEMGPEGLSLSVLHDRLGGRVSKTAPLHHFGSMTGLCAAVAADGFDTLTDALREARESLDPRENAARVLAIRFGAFAFQRRNLYRTMHLPVVWAAVEASGYGPSDPDPGEKVPAEVKWLRAVERARDGTFREFVFAVQLGQAAGTLRSDVAAREIARLLTALVDGLLFQALVERVPSDSPVEELARYVGLAIEGLVPSAGGMR